MNNEEAKPYFDVSRSNKKRTLIFLWILILISIFVLASYLFPFFSIINSQTRQNILTITGFDVAFGKYNQYESLRVNPNAFVMIGYILGFFGVLFLIIFTIWFSLSKKYNRFMFFILSLSTPCYACLLASQFFIIQLYKTNNLTGFANMEYIHYCYFISISLTGIIFLTTLITLVVIAVQGDKTPLVIETE